MNRFTPRALSLVPLLMAGLAAASLTHADSGRQLPRDMPAAYVQECGSGQTCQQQERYEGVR